jgi:hypothetical protein
MALVLSPNALVTRATRPPEAQTAEVVDTAGAWPTMRFNEFFSGGLCPCGSIDKDAERAIREPN